MSLIPAIISLVVLGLGLIFILITLLTYFSTWKKTNFSIQNEKLIDISSPIYHSHQQPINVNHLNEDDNDLTNADELSTLV